MSAGMRFAVFLTVVLGVWLVQHLYVGWRLLSLPFFESDTARRWLLAGLAGGFVSYPLGRSLYGLGWHVVGRALEYVGAVWMGALFLLLAFLVMSDILTLGGWVLRPWVARIRTRPPALWRCAARNEGEFRQACIGAAAAGDERDVQLVVQILAAQERGRAGNDRGRRQSPGDKFAPRHWARWCHFRRRFHAIRG